MDCLDEALKDLKHAVQLDPSNLEVRKELRKIEEVLGHAPIQFKEEEGKLTSLECQVFNPHTEASYEDCNNVQDTNLCPQRKEGSRLGVIFNHNKRRRENHEDQMVHAHAPSENSMSCVEDRTSLSRTKSPACSMDEDGVKTTPSKLTFRSKRKESGLSISLSKLSYELLTKGKQLEFYDPIRMSHMSVRIPKVEFSASATPPPLEEYKPKDENQQIQRESQVQQQDQESEQMSMEKHGDKDDCNTKPYNSQDLTISRKNPSRGTATVYCPKKFKRLRLSRV